MRHFLGYHNAEGMKYSSTTISYPHIKTSKSVDKLNGVTVWLIAGEGSSPKSYFLVTTFIASSCEDDKYRNTKLPNEISGNGPLYKLTKRLPDALVDLLKKNSANFRKGFYELSDASIIAQLSSL